jgi:hypothetical protein
MLKRSVSAFLFLAVPAAAQRGDHAAPTSAARELDTLTRAVQRYRDVEVAQAEGWEPSPLGREDAALMGEHWIRKGARDYAPGEPLDFTEPSNLQYARVKGRRELVGVSYVVRIAPGQPLPQGFSGAADHWHVHDVLRGMEAATEGRPVLRWLANAWIDREYRSKGDDRSRLAMVHAWVTTPSPDGVFSMHNRAIPYLRVGLPLSFARGATDETAMGVDLASPKGCENALGGTLWIAHAKPAQKRSLEATCVGLAVRMRAAVATRDERTVDAAGAAVWAELDGARRATLSPDQLRRIASVTEHDSMSAPAHGTHH